MSKRADAGIVVKVTAEDIATGESAEDRCPVALALLRATGALGAIVATDVMVRGSYAVNWWTSDEDFRAILPPEAKRFVDCFDDGVEEADRVDRDTDEAAPNGGSYSVRLRHGTKIRPFVFTLWPTRL